MGRFLITVVALAALVAGCGDEANTQAEPGPADETTGPTTPEPQATASGTAPEPTATAPEPTAPATTTPTQRQRPGTIVTTADSDYGTMLFDKSGQAIYLFDKETTERPRCYRACAKAWPPVLTGGEPRARGQVESRLLGITERKDGSRQVTYGGHPLYYYAHEGKGEVLCHDVEEYGGVWLVVQPSGDPAP